VWTLSGECVGEYYGHASFVFAVAAVPGTNLIASASEDHTVKLWHRTRLFVFVAADCSKHTQLIYSFIYTFIFSFGQRASAYRRCSTRRRSGRWPGWRMETS
jgi:WD40 repeat protein